MASAPYRGSDVSCGVGYGDTQPPGLRETKERGAEAPLPLCAQLLLGGLVLGVVVVEVLVVLRVETVLHDRLLRPVVLDPVAERVELRLEGLVDGGCHRIRNDDVTFVLLRTVGLYDLQHVTVP